MCVLCGYKHCYVHCAHSYYVWICTLQYMHMYTDTLKLVGSGGIEFTDDSVSFFCTEYRNT